MTGAEPGRGAHRILVEPGGGAGGADTADTADTAGTEVTSPDTADAEVTEVIRPGTGAGADVIDSTGSEAGPVRPGAVRPGAGARPPWGRPVVLLEWLLATALAAATLVTHNLAHVLGQPYWIDEAWVADSVRAPVTDATAVTGSSPIGWTLLLRLAVIGGQQRQRLVPLLVLAAAVVVAYLLGRRSPLPRPLGGTLAAGAVLFMPHMLGRNDLKQYTADACTALLLLLLTARAEERPSRVRLAVLVLAAPLAMLFSHTALLVGAATLLGLAGAMLVRRAWRRLLEVVAGGVLAAVGMGLVYVAFDRPHVIPSLSVYWRRYYLPSGGFEPAWHYISTRWTQLHALTNLGPGWLAAALVAAGVVTLAATGRIGAALSVPVLLAGLLEASAQQKYPLLDQRTSTFLFAIFAVLAALGVAGIAYAMFALARWGGSRAGRHRAGTAGTGRPARPAVVSRAVGVVLAAAVVLTAGIAYVVPATAYLRRDTVPLEDVRSATEWVQGLLQPQDVVIVGYGAQFGYAYYAASLRPRFTPDNRIAAGFVLASDDAQHLVVITPTARTPAGMQAALAHARTLLGPGGRIYVVRSHETAGEQAAFDSVPPAAQRRWVGALVTVY